MLRTLLLSLLFAAAGNAITLQVATSGGNASSSTLYGIMFEDINNSGDGGIHGQVLKNNGFQGTSPGLTAWSAVGDVTISQSTSNPLSSAITSTIEIAVPSGASGQVGIQNAGYAGVPVNEGVYANYFWIKGNYNGEVTLQLKGSSGTVYASSSLAVDSTANEFTYYEETGLMASQSYESNNIWELTFNAGSVAGSSLYIGLPQLFPVTYHERYNGIRNDVGTYLEQIKPSFLRFPGGNNIEGQTPSDRWQWNNTIGPVQNRPGRQGDWGYANTDALGLMEYMYWINDMGMQPVLAVWSGLSLGGTVVEGSALNPYVTDILNELEFLLGSTDTTYGALRSEYGQADPFVVNFIEVGNEDNLSGGCGSYPGRFTAIYDAVHTAYPDITLIASTSDTSCLPDPLPEGVWMDVHYYLSPNSFVDMFNEWDNAPRKNNNYQVVLEYASTTGNDGSTTYWSNMQGSCAEAVYMIGVERNSDLVKMASFAPLLEHYNLAEWSPDLFGLNSTVGSITGSTSFWVQEMFSSNRGTMIHSVTASTGFGPVYWVASSNGNTYYVKLANYGSSSESITVTFSGTSFSSAATLTSLSGGETVSNYPGIVSITPQASTVSGSSTGGYTFNIPAWGVAVLAVTA